MTLTDSLTIAGLILGPTAAVLISLRVEDQRQIRLRKSNAIRTLLLGRLNFADPAFQIAINSVPVDFPKDEDVLAAWEAYLAAVQVPPDPPNDPAAQKVANDRWNTALSNLLQAMLIASGYRDRSAAQIARSTYVSGSSAERWNLQQAALQAVVKIADNIGRLADINEKIFAQMPPASDATGLAQEDKD